jgi:excisionase family DNA binding protein
MPDLTVAQAAAAVGVSERTMRRWIRDGRIDGCYKVGGRVRIPERAIQEVAEPYGERSGPRPSVEELSILDSPARAREFQLQRARLAFEEIDRIRARGRPPSGPDDTAEAYIREWRDGPPRWERDIDDR